MQTQTSPTKKRRPTGISERHSRSCRSLTGAKCDCKPSFRAWVYDRHSGTKIRRTFPTLSAAKAWRDDAAGMMRRGALAAPTRRTVRQAGDEWLEKAKAGEARNRSGQVYKPSVLRGYESDLRLYLYTDLGAVKLSDLRRRDVQDLVDRLVGKGLSGSKVRNALMPLRVIIRHALERDELIANPLTNLRMPALGEGRQRAASPVEAAELVASLADGEQAIWATAFYAGLRRGELRALRVRDVDLEASTITIERGWDDVAGPIAPKSRAGARTVFLLDALLPYLEPRLAELVGQPEAFLLGSKPTTPFEPGGTKAKADAAWKAANLVRAEQELEPLQPILLHEARHSFSTALDHAGVSESRADRYMGHSDGSVAGRYRHLLAKQIAEDRKTVDAYLTASSAGKVVQIAASA